MHAWAANTVKNPVSWLNTQNPWTTTFFFCWGRREGLPLAHTSILLLILLPLGSQDVVKQQVKSSKTAFTARRKKGMVYMEGHDTSDKTPLGWRTPWKRKYLQQPSPELPSQPAARDNQNLTVRSLGGHGVLQKNRAAAGETGSRLSVSQTNITSLTPKVQGISTSPGSNRSSEGSVRAK